MAEKLRPGVGMRLRTFRERHGWSLRELAQRCGLSINAISRIERGENSPTVASLNKLAVALGVPITDFFTERNQETAILMQRDNRPKSENGCFMAEPLVDLTTYDTTLEPLLLTIAPRCHYEAEASGHPGDEFVHCLEGEIEYQVNDETYRLGAGDSLLFQAMLPHSWRNPQSTPASVLLVFLAAQDNSLARAQHFHLFRESD
ncbi:MAG TPA: cupin domain-containing protein [Anaerolineales bacterium]|nr:cupin domain-containing protein [Anaerolineales bacterium]